MFKKFINFHCYVIIRFEWICFSFFRYSFDYCHLQISNLYFLYNFKVNYLFFYINNNVCLWCIKVFIWKAFFFTFSFIYISCNFAIPYVKHIVVGKKFYFQNTLKIIIICFCWRISMMIILEWMLRFLFVFHIPSVFIVEPILFFC